MARSGHQSLKSVIVLLLIGAVTVACLAGPLYVLSGWVASPIQATVCQKPPATAVAVPKPAAPAIAARPSPAAPAHRLGWAERIGVVVGLAFFLLIWVIASLAVIAMHSFPAIILPVLATGTALALAARHVGFIRSRVVWMAVGTGAGLAYPSWYDHPAFPCRPIDHGAALVAGFLSGWLLRTILRGTWIERPSA